MSGTYKNPMSFNTADPVILYHDGKYYCYGTNAKDGFCVHSSSDLNTWTNVGKIFENYDGFMGEDCFWAPEVYKRDGRFILLFSSRDKNKRHSIYIAFSDSPTGPFKDANNGKPFFCPPYSIIDGSLLFDDDGRIYMYYSRDCSENIVNEIHESHIYVVELSKDLCKVISEPIHLTSPDCEWEKLSGNEFRWNEGPCTLKHNGTYYLMYTANFYASIHYAVGYATSSSPTGPFIKSPDNPILRSNGVETMGTGHNNFFPSPDGKELFCVYHSLKNRLNNKDGRVPNIDRMYIEKDGKLRIDGPTVCEMPLPSTTAIK